VAMSSGKTPDWQSPIPVFLIPVFAITYSRCVCPA